MGNAAEGARTGALFALCISMGMLSILNANVNNTLAAAFAGGTAVASCINFYIGALTLAVAYFGWAACTALVRHHKGESLEGFKWKRPSRWYEPLGGLLGSSYLTLTLVSTAIVGNSVHVVCRTVGMLLGAILFDHYGILGTPKLRVTLPRIGAVLVCVAGVVFISWESFSGDTDPGLLILFAAVSILTGPLLVTQSALNGLLSTSVGGSKIRSTIVSFSVGSLFLTLVAGIWCAANEEVARAVVDPVETLDFWKFTGGIMSAVFISAPVFLNPIVGTAIFYIGFIAGALIMSVIFDSFGVLAAEVQEFTWSRGVGLGLTLAGAVAVQVLVKRDRDRLASASVVSEESDEDSDMQETEIAIIGENQDAMKMIRSVNL